VWKKYPARKVELGEDAIGGLDRLVDVLVRHPDRVRPHLGGAHGGLERGEAVVEGSEDGDHPVRVPLAPLQRVPQHARPLRQRLRRLRPRRRRHHHIPRFHTTLLLLLLLLTDQATTPPPSPRDLEEARRGDTGLFWKVLEG
jgi:hypothetical protein